MNKEDRKEQNSVNKLIKLMSHAQEQKIRLYVVRPGSTVMESNYQEIDFLLHGYMGTMPLSRATNIEIQKNNIMRELEADVLNSIERARKKLEELSENHEGKR